MIYVLFLGIPICATMHPFQWHRTAHPAMRDDVALPHHFQAVAGTREIAKAQNKLLRLFCTAWALKV